MGILSTQRQRPTYVPPLGGADNVEGDKFVRTLLGARSDASERIQASEDRGLPARSQGTWRIELRYLPIAHRGHAFLALIDPDGRTRSELHGLARSRTTGEVLPFGPDGSELRAMEFDRQSDIGKGSSRAADVAAGSYDDIVGTSWARGLQVISEINKRSFDYKSHDPAYELGGDGGQIQNSNSAAFTFGQNMGLDLDGALRRTGMDRRFPGWSRNLLDPRYRRYVAPPQFG